MENIRITLIDKIVLSFLGAMTVTSFVLAGHFNNNDIAAARARRLLTSGAMTPVVLSATTTERKPTQPVKIVEKSKTTQPNTYEIFSDVYEVKDAPKKEETIAKVETVTPTPVPTSTPKPKKTVMNMTKKQLNALSVKQKAKLIGISEKSFKMMAEVVNHEAGQQMNDKIMVAAVIFNRVHCNQFRNSIQGVINEPGQFYDLSKDHSATWKDKKAQLAVLLAYKKIKQGKIPRNVLYFNSIGFGSKNRKRYVKYKHYNNYFLIDKYCKCK